MTALENVANAQREVNAAEKRLADLVSVGDALAGRQRYLAVKLEGLAYPARFLNDAKAIAELESAQTESAQTVALIQANEAAQAFAREALADARAGLESAEIAALHRERAEKERAALLVYRRYLQANIDLQGIRDEFDARKAEANAVEYALRARKVACPSTDAPMGNLPSAMSKVLARLTELDAQLSGG